MIKRSRKKKSMKLRLIGLFFPSYPITLKEFPLRQTKNRKKHLERHLNERVAVQAEAIRSYPWDHSKYDLTSDEEHRELANGT